MNCAICPPGLASLKSEATRVLERPCVGLFQRTKTVAGRWNDSHFCRGLYTYPLYGFPYERWDELSKLPNIRSLG